MDNEPDQNRSNDHTESDNDVKINRKAIAKFVVRPQQRTLTFLRISDAITALVTIFGLGKNFFKIGPLVLSKSIYSFPVTRVRFGQLWTITEARMIK